MKIKTHTFSYSRTAFNQSSSSRMKLKLLGILYSGGGQYRIILEVNENRIGGIILHEI